MQGFYTVYLGMDLQRLMQTLWLLSRAYCSRLRDQKANKNPRQTEESVSFLLVSSLMLRSNVLPSSSEIVNYHIVFSVLQL